MALTSGTKLGPCEIIAPLGAGGMGEVYSARDVRLDRMVAVKVLHAEFSRDEDRLHRFEHEARILSTLVPCGRVDEGIAIASKACRTGVSGGAVELYSQRTSGTQPQALGVDADVLGIADNGDMAVILKHRYLASWLERGTLARLPVDGGRPRSILENVYAADISRDGKEFAVVRSAGNQQRLEFPIGKVLFETLGWINDVRIAPDGAHIAFLEHPLLPDDQGRVVLADLQGNSRALTPLYSSSHGIAWTPDGKELWHSESIQGEEAGIYAVNLNGQVRVILRSPIEVHIQDISSSNKVLLESVR